jgi:uncharacterized coiled-coil protein SlyX
LPKVTVDELLEAVEAVDFLRTAVAEQEKGIALILGQLDLLRERLDALEASTAHKLQ